MISLQTLLTAWKTFFFAPEPVTTLVLFRIFVGALCLVNAICHLLNAPELYSPDAMVPWRVFRERQGKTRFTFLNWLPPTRTSVLMVLWGEILFAACLTLGICSRSACIGLFLTMTSVHHRNMDVLDASDTIIRLFVFLLCFAPAGAALSVDSILTGTARDAFPSRPPWALRLIQIQVSLIYVQSVRLKLLGQLWRQGTAAWYPLQLERFVRGAYPRRVFGQRHVLRTLTWSVLAVELAAGVLVWIKELRLPMTCVALTLHFGFSYFLQLRLFGFVMAAGLLTFVPPETTSIWINRVSAWVPM